MLVLDAETLAKHYVKGAISRKQFVSLSTSLLQLKQGVQSKSLVARLVKLFRFPRELLIYSIKWRIKSIWRLFKYTFLSLLVIFATVIWRIDIDDLEDIQISGLDINHIVELFMAGVPEPLPDDIRMATEYMLNTEVWGRQHVKQYRNQWLSLEDREQRLIRNTAWFQEFSLLAAIKKVEQEKRFVSGDVKSLRHLKDLNSLTESIS